MDHLQKLQCRFVSPTNTDNSEAEQDLDIELEPITVQEVKDAIRKLKNGKAPGDDNVYI